MVKMWLSIALLYAFSPFSTTSAATPNVTTPSPTTHEWNSWHTPPPSNQGQIEYRLTRLEVLLQEKLETLRTEVRDSGRRLQALEWQSAETQSTVESLRADLARFMQQMQLNASPSGGENGNSVLEHRVENLAKGVQLVVAATRGLNSDIVTLKRNVSSLINETRNVYEENKHLVTQHFFQHGISELRNHWVPTQYLSCPTRSQPHETNVYRNCKEVQHSKKPSGIYLIQPQHSPKPFIVFCDMVVQGGGWTVIQNRFKGSQDFYQNWHEYKHGFGNLGGEFWLGLENIHQLTGYEINEIYIELQDFEAENRTAHYNAFSIGPELEGYQMKVLGDYSGDAGDSLTYHAGCRFSTKDMDQDEWPEGSCAQSHGGGWWYKSCDASNLNGKYLSGALPEQFLYQGMYWGEFKGAQYSLQSSRMLVRPQGSGEKSHQELINRIFDADALQGPGAQQNPPAVPYDS